MSMTITPDDFLIALLFSHEHEWDNEAKDKTTSPD